MKYEKMNDLLLEINCLKNIRSIKYSDLFLTTNNKINILPSIIVFYDNMKCINLCINDKYFYELLRKVKEVYLEEKNKEKEELYSNPFYHNLGIKIEIDPLTKKMLEESNIEEINELYKDYIPSKSYNNSLLFDNDEVNTLLPIVEYNIKETLKQFDKTINFNEKIDGYKDKFTYKVKVNGLFHKIFLDYKKNTFNEYEITVNNLFNNLEQLKINISFNNDSIIIKNSIEELDYVNTYKYLITGKNILEIHTTHIKDELTSYSENVLEKTDNIYLNNFNNKEELNWYKLPWNGLFGFIEKTDPISSVETIEYINYTYFSSYENGFVSREMISKVYRKNIKAYDYLSVELERVERVNTGINKDNHLWIIESKFNDNGTNGYYKNYLSGKYYYYTCTYRDIKDINLEELIPLDKENYEVFDKTDLLRKTKLLKIARKNLGE